jgi:hypothetical protein
MEIVAEMDNPAHFSDISLDFLAGLETPPRRDEVGVVVFLQFYAIHGYVGRLHDHEPF